MRRRLTAAAALQLLLHQQSSESQSDEESESSDSDDSEVEGPTSSGRPARSRSRSPIRPTASGDHRNDEEWFVRQNTDLLLPRHSRFEHQGGPVKNFFVDCHQEMDYFKKFLNEDIMNFLIEHINAYAERKKSMNSPPLRRSYFSNWKPITHDEFMRFLAILYNMGIYHRPAVKDYWRVDFQSRHPWFSSVMKREKFQVKQTII